MKPEPQMLGREIHVKHPLFGWGVKNQNWPQRTKDFKRDRAGFDSPHGHNGG